MLKRKEYIDTAKGMLMLTVIMAHIPAVADNCGIVPGGAMRCMSEFFSIFFMPAFFMITGYCSNFNKGFYLFAKSNFKNLIIVGLSLYLFNVALSVILTLDLSSFKSILLLPKILIGRGSYYWFLSALFIAKITYYTINKNISDAKLKVLFSFLLPVLLFYIDPKQKIYDFWYFEQAIYLLPFMSLGNYSQNRVLFHNVKLLIMYPLIYIIVWFILRHYMVLPSVTMIINMPGKESLYLYFILSFMGSLALISLAKIVNQNKLLQYAGRTSIIIYTTHIELLLFFENRLQRLLIYENTGILWYIMVLSLTFLVTIIIGYILNVEKLKFILLK